MITLILVVLSGITKAFMDAAAHGKLSGDFWNEKEAWKYKWKNGDKSQGEAFPGSSTIFVFVTSGWHLLQMIFLVTITTAIVCYKPIVKPLWDFLILSATLRVIFEGIYRKI
jgi:hypothetical protein